MNLTLGYVKERLLNAGSKLQHAIVHEDITECVYDSVHDAQNQLALGLAALVQIEHDQVSTAADFLPPAIMDGIAAKIPTPITDTIVSIDSVGQLIRALRKEADRKRPDLANANMYTSTERGVLLRASALLESVHPSLLDS